MRYSGGGRPGEETPPPSRGWRSGGARLQSTCVVTTPDGRSLILSPHLVYTKPMRKAARGSLGNVSPLAVPTPSPEAIPAIYGPPEACVTSLSLPASPEGGVPKDPFSLLCDVQAKPGALSQDLALGPTLRSPLQLLFAPPPLPGAVRSSQEPRPSGYQTLFLTGLC